MDFLYAQEIQSGGIAAFLPFILIMFIIYFLMIRPQTKRQKDKETMRESLKKGDKVITMGGIYGTIQGFKEKNRLVILKVDNNTNLTLNKTTEDVEVKERKKPKYTPLSKRQDRPDAILWLCKNYPEINDGQISKLVGSTKGTVSLIRKRSYWNFSSLKARDPVILALCTQEVFEKALEKSKRRVEREKKNKIKEEKKLQKENLKNDQ